MEKNIKNIRADFKNKGIFYTPSELAEMIRGYIDFDPKAVYDPTCGQGNLLAVFDDSIPKYGQEIDADELEKARERLKSFTGYCGDTLKKDCFVNVTFDAIVANPPFSIKWEPNDSDWRFLQADKILPPGGKADYAFVLHILAHLAKPGKAVILEFPGILYRGQRERKIRQWMIERNLIERVVRIPGNTFVDTAIETCMIVLNKNKHTTDIIFEDREHQEERTVTQDEIKENGFVLSVSTYVQHEEPKEEIDIDALNDELTERAINGLKMEIEKRKMLSDIAGKPDPTRVLVARTLRAMAEILEN